MKAISRVELSSGKIFINVVLTEEETKHLIEGNVVSFEDSHLNIQVVGYGEESEGSSE